MLASICYAALGMVLHLFVSLLHLIWPTWGFLLGFELRLVAGDGTGVGAGGASVAVGVGPRPCGRHRSAWVG